MGLSMMTSIVGAVLMMLVVFGYWRLVQFDRGSWEDCTIKGVVLVLMQAILRSGYWDIGQFVAGDHWVRLRDQLGGQDFSTVFNVLRILGAFYLLRGMVQLIPQPHRQRWRWWSAWWYFARLWAHAPPPKK